MKNVLTLLFLLALAGCASLGMEPIQAPPEFDQKILLKVSENYKQHQAPRSGYDVGDLQAFHSQHTLPIVIEDAFKEIFGQVEMVESEAGIETAAPDVPALFEVRIIDLAHDVYTESTSYRAEVTLAAAMKSPESDHIFWQQAFRGEGYTVADPQFQTGLGPQDAVLDAVRDAIDQMQRAIIGNPQVRLQMQHYQQIQQARQEKEVTV